MEIITGIIGFLAIMLLPIFVYKQIVDSSVSYFIGTTIFVGIFVSLTGLSFFFDLERYVHKELPIESYLTALILTVIGFRIIDGEKTFKAQKGLNIDKEFWTKNILIPIIVSVISGLILYGLIGK